MIDPVERKIAGSSSSSDPEVGRVWVARELERFVHRAEKTRDLAR